MSEQQGSQQQGSQQQQQTENVQVQHGDIRQEKLIQKYGELAALKVEDLRKRAFEQGVERPSDKNKEELLQALTGKGGGGGGGGGSQ